MLYFRNAVNVKKYLSRKISGYILIAIVSVIGAVMLVLSQAAQVPVVLQSEAGVINNGAVVMNSNDTSGNAYIRLGKGIALGGASPGGTYADWFYSASGLDSIEWTQHIVEDPAVSMTSEGVLHYFAYTFGLNNQNSTVGFGYAGFQTNALYQGVYQGKGINYSFWASNGGKTVSPGLLETNNLESGGNRIVYPYNWVVGRKYRFQLKNGPSGTDSLGKWWGLWMTDLTTSTQTYLGELRMPITINGVNSTQLEPHTGAFGEDTHWWYSLGGSRKYTCSGFQRSSQATINVTANNAALLPSRTESHTNSLDPSQHPDNGYQTTNCPVSVYTNSKNDVQMNLGYWNPGAADVIKNN